MQTKRDHVPSAAPPFPAPWLVSGLDTGYKIEPEAVSPVEPARLPSDAYSNSEVLCFEDLAAMPLCFQYFTGVQKARSKAKSLFVKILHEIGGRGSRSFSGLSLPKAICFTLLATTLSAVASAQGILTVTPTRTAATTAGTGAVGYSGDGSSATTATLANPSAVAYDSAGDLFLADANNHVVREVSAAGVITTVAGTGVEGYSGDGGAATSAQLDTPTGVAVDASGNIYIADSHNHRIREVIGGNISTIAGTGVAGFSGDGSSAKSAQLSLPSGVAVDTSGNVYIADTNNHRIRKISGGNISTIAGDGEELFAGDGGAATAAALDSPTAVAVDASGNVYIADRLNQRIREVSGGNISTIAGSGSASFSGSFAGDGANATAASLARPSGVSVDASGNVYIADSDNQRVRQVSSTGTIGTVVGSGAQGFSGDSNAATSAILNAPRSVATDASGNLSIADRQNQRIRAGLLPALTFANDGVGLASTAQSITLANTGSVSITVSTLTFAGPFTTANGGNCGSTPITLATGATCTQNVVFLPVATGAANGSVIFGGTGVVPQKILLSGTGIQSSSTTTLISNLATPLTGQAVTFTATVKPAGLGTATGNVTFYDGATPLGTMQLASGSTSLTTAALPDGTNSITAVYNSDPNFTTSTSAVLPQLVEDFQLAVSGVTVLSVVPGTSATFGGFVSSPTGAFSYPVVLSITGLPAGAIATFNPASVTLGTAPVPVTVTIQTAAVARMHYPGLIGGSTAALALLILPFGRRFRRRIPRARIWLSLLMLFALGSLVGLSGCGTGSGLFGQQQQTYTVSLVGTATGANGATLQRSISYTLTVQ
jgi:sugar lactone lactonase YvrE